MAPKEYITGTLSVWALTVNGRNKKHFLRKVLITA